MARIVRRLLSPVYKLYERKLERQIRKSSVPHHLAVIMDGNRRYADSLGIPSHEGHKMGKGSLENLSDWCRGLGIHHLTVYAFSLENFNRSDEELNPLMDLFEESFRNAGDDSRVHKHKIRVIRKLKIMIQNYNIAVAYGGRQEIVRSMKRIAREIELGTLKSEEIDADLISANLYTSDIPDPDLILRSSGEERISNFLLWQLAYSEFYFTDVFWPEIRKIDLLSAIRSYQKRRRRIGR